MKQFALIICLLCAHVTAWGAFTCPADPTQTLQYTPWALQLSSGQVPAPVPVQGNAFGLLVLAVAVSRRLRPARFKGSRTAEFAVLLLLAGTVPTLLAPVDLLAQPAPVPVPGPFAQPGFSAVGTFRALPGGVLKYNLSIMGPNSRATRIEDGTGIYTLAADCSGGTLLFNNNIAPMQLQFRFVEGFGAMLLATDSTETLRGGWATHQQEFGVAKPAPAFCPPNITMPVSVLAGTKWAVRGAGTLSPGILRVSEDPFNASLLSTYSTTKSNIRTSKLSVDPGCGGGSISMGPLQWDFVYSGRFDEMFLLNTTTQPAALPFAIGTAQLIQPNTCPADPTQLLQGAPWAFRLETPGGGDAGARAIGTFKAFPGSYLQVDETIQANGVLTRGGQFRGRYSVDADCSGGSLSFMANALPVQLDFIFAGPDEILFTTNSQGSFGPYTAAAIASTNTGSAKRTAGACPAGGTPADLVGGIGSILAFGNSGVAPVGQLQVTGPGNVQIFKSYLESRSNDANFVVAPGCGGGSISLGPLQWDFVLAGVDRNEIYFLGNVLSQGGTSPSAATGPIYKCPCPIGNKQW